MTQPASETAPAVEAPATPPAVEDAPPAQAKPETDWKAEARKHEARAKENAGAAAKLAALEDAAKTDAERLNERAAAAEKRVADLEMAALRSTVAAKHGIAPDLLHGDTVEALNEHAAKLTAWAKAARPTGDVDQGVQEHKGGVSQLSLSDLKGMKPGEIELARKAGRLDRLMTGT